MPGRRLRRRRPRRVDPATLLGVGRPRHLRRRCTTRTGSAADSSPSGSAPATSSSPATPRTCGCRTPGYGMNAGIADATTLAWLLAARTAGMGARRRSSTPTRPSGSRSPTRSRSFAMDHVLKNAARARRGRRPQTRGLRGRTGEALRAHDSARLRDAQRRPVRAAPGSTSATSTIARRSSPTTEGAAALHHGHVTPSTVPGCRLPHFGWPTGGSVYDALGPTTRSCASTPGSTRRRSMRPPPTVGLPLALLDATRPPTPDVFGIRCSSCGATSTSPGGATTCPPARGARRPCCAALRPIQRRYDAREDQH